MRERKPYCGLVWSECDDDENEWWAWENDVTTKSTGENLERRHTTGASIENLITQSAIYRVQTKH